MAGVRVVNHRGLMALVMVAVLAVSGGGLVAAAANIVPAVYIFGDSTVDVGNNGVMPPPYGIDFPHDSDTNGRFSNGYNIADSFSRLVGFNMSPPAYLTLTPATSSEILRGFGGVNYASGGSGILDTTGMAINNSISMAEQVEYFAATKAKMIAYAGGEGSAAIDTLLSKSLFLISAGGNDLFDVLLNLTQLPSFYTRLSTKFKNHLQTLYDLGARRFGVVGVPPVGCVPGIRALTAGGQCDDNANSLARGVNKLLSNEMAELAADRTGVTYSVGSSYNLVTYFTENPAAAGLSNVTSACCGGGLCCGDGLWPCVLPDTTICENRADHIFWDLVHGTQAIANKGAAIVFAAPVEEGFAAPINFQQLVSPNDGFDGFSSS